MWNARAPAGAAASDATFVSSTAASADQPSAAVPGVPVESGAGSSGVVSLTDLSLKTQFVAHPGAKPALKVLFSPDSTCAPNIDIPYAMSYIDAHFHEDSVSRRGRLQIDGHLVGRRQRAHLAHVGSAVEPDGRGEDAGKSSREARAGGGGGRRAT